MVTYDRRKYVPFIYLENATKRSHNFLECFYKKNRLW